MNYQTDLRAIVIDIAKDAVTQYLTIYFDLYVRAESIIYRFLINSIVLQIHRYYWIKLNKEWYNIMRKIHFSFKCIYSMNHY